MFKSDFLKEIYVYITNIFSTNGRGENCTLNWVGKTDEKSWHGKSRVTWEHNNKRKAPWSYFYKYYYNLVHCDQWSHYETQTDLVRI